MNQIIHPTAIIDPKAQIGNNVEIGPFSIIGPKVILQDGVKISSNVVIDGRTTIGKGCRIFHSAVIGTEPQDLKYAGEDTAVEIGEYTTIREFATINRSSNIEQPTLVGSYCLLMIYTHVAHDCKLGGRVILANSVNLAGHVIIENNATIGGLTPVHQFVHIGCFAFIGGLSRVTQDVAPYTRGASVPYKTVGLNSVGLRRSNFSAETRAILKKLYKIFYNSNLNTAQALEKIKSEIEMIDEVKHFVEFVENSERGIAK
ncbi:MAG: acyl-ACP--UDP-N-acetylglucosamine O-acyltransferase [Candidatus Celaenobacter antarcticus]|nr:acyl-ACP--UDP-N-acetylglucosamine O-acyltransferase [Candidatus Celaenobacter antarcticus]MDP8315092.1 acyl-ACP--UDP-N-acetylglucosamine O-acyltransferase [Candidatus Celaenobacter antarcticus]